MEWKEWLCGPVSWQDSLTVISKHGAITCFQGPPLFRDALAQSSVLILQASIVPCNDLERIPALAHKGNTLIYTEHNGSLPLRLPQEALMSFQDKSLGRQRQKGRHWSDRVRKQNYSYRGWQTGKAIRRLVFGQFKKLISQPEDAWVCFHRPWPLPYLMSIPENHPVTSLEMNVYICDRSTKGTST